MFNSPQFHILLDLIKTLVPGALPVPFIMNGATDARLYMEICDRVFRFSPFLLESEENESVHGINERLSFENAARIVSFMIEVIEKIANIDSDELEEEELEEELELDDELVSKAIRELESPLPTRPMKQLEREPIEEETDFFDDDEPLEVKPMK